MMMKGVLTLNLTKHYEFFNPEEVTEPIHIIGIGAIGSNVVNQLVRLGFTNLHLYDFDEVNSHNISNQLYFNSDIGKTKLEATNEHIKLINPNIEVKLYPKGWVEKTPLEGHVILAVDNIELRKQIAEENKDNFKIISMTDYRMGLEDAQMYFANWHIMKEIEAFIKSMSFKRDEIVDVVSACGTTLSVLPTIQSIVSYGVMNLLNFNKTNKQKYNTMLMVDTLAGIAKGYKF